MSPRSGASPRRAHATLPAALVIPCFNEAERLPVEDLRRLAEGPELALVLVDDGSTDGTGQMLRDLAASLPRVEALLLPRNAGKGEAVRAGLNHAFERGFALAGYADADMATPVEELLALLDFARAGKAQLVMGSRVQLLGRRIVRSPWRHYLGRVFATGASLALDLPVYDTQCGAKFLRDSAAVRSALSRPFRSRWAFDVELIARLLEGGGTAPALSPEEIVEFPLGAWVDVRGSKVRPVAALRAALDLLSVARQRRRL